MLKLKASTVKMKAYKLLLNLHFNIWQVFAEDVQSLFLFGAWRETSAATPL